jgi:hypothetical protein
MWFNYPSKLCFKPSLSGDMCQKLIQWKTMRFKIIKIKIYYIILFTLYIISDNNIYYKF